MKKFSILALAALLVVALTVPAAALENEFGGYWRTRMYQQNDFNGERERGDDERLVDTRTRLYYTAKINDNLKLVNKFEMDAVWGEDEDGGTTEYDVVDAAGNTIGTTTVDNPNRSLYGDIGADGVRVEVKNSYADFNTGPVNWTVGVQPYALFRSFHIDADASGIIGRWKIMDNFVLAGSWLKAYEGGSDAGINDDADTYTLSGAFYFSENISIKPSFSWLTSSDAQEAITAISPLAFPAGVTAGEADIYTYGFDFDASFDMFSVWLTAYGQTGDLDLSGASDLDFKGWLAAVGGNVMLGPVDLHGEFIYTPGDDDPTDGDYDAIFSPSASYYWSEIMGYGVFDNQVSVGSPADKVQNLIAANIGAGFKPMDKLSLTLDVWWAQLEEDDANGEDELGTEVDLRITYELVEGLNLDLVGAYLFAGDATSLDGSNDEDPYEIGAQLSLSF
jgi:hypothetical protein